MKHKTRTKALSWLLSLALVLSLVPGMGGTAHATDNSWESGNCTVALNGTTLTVSKKAGDGNGKMADYTGDDGDNKAPWVSVRESVTSVVISDGVTGIGDYAIYHFSNLTSLSIADTVTSIGEDAFSLCDSLKNITIPVSVTNIGKSAFYTSESGRRVIFIRPESESSLTVANDAFYYLATLAYSDGGNYSLFAGDSEIELSGTNNGDKLNGKTLTWKLPIFSITDNSVHGSVTASVGGSNVTRAEVGNTVTLTVTPASGYQFKSIKATTPKEGVEDFNDLVSLMGTAVFEGDNGYTNFSGYICKAEDDKFVVYNGTTLVAETANISGFNVGSYGVSFSCGDISWSFSISDNKITRIILSDTANNYNTLFDSAYPSESNGSLQPSNLELTTVTAGSKYSFTMPKKSVTVTAEFEESTHEHSFTYTVNDATITATCNASDRETTCPLKNNTYQATLILAASDAAYTGSAYTGASVTNNIPAVSGDTVGSVAYYKVSTQGATTGGMALTGAPTDVGYYYASVTLTSGGNSYTAVKAFTISPKALTITGATLTARNYAEDDKNVTVSAVTFDNATLTLGTDYTATAEMANDTAGSAKPATVTVTLTNGNYSLAQNTYTGATVQINKIEYTGSKTAAANLRGTNGATAEVTLPALPTGASYGAVTNSNTTYFTVDAVAGGKVTVTAAKNFDQATESAAKTFTVAVTGATNYNDYAVTVTITPVFKAEQTITAENITATYGDTDKSVSASVTEPTTGGGAISYAVKEGSGDYIDVAADGKLTIKAVPPDDGKAYVIVTAAENDTYAETTKEVAVTISTKAMTVSASGYSGYYDGSAHGITVTVTAPSSGYTVKYGETQGTYNHDTSPTLTAAGTKTVYYQVTADNYTTYTGSATISISAKQPQTITASNVTATYGDTNAKVSATTNGNGAISYAVKSGSDVVDVNPSTGDLTIKKAGTAIVTVTAAETATYAAATKNVTVTVNTKTMTVSAENVTVTADGQPHGITVTVTAPASGYTVKYGTTEGTYDLDASPTQTEAGTLTVYYQVTADNYITKTGSATVTVRSKSSQTITASNVTATYGDTGVSISATTSGNGTLSYALKSGSAVTVNAATGALTIVKAGTAVVTVTASSTSTYTSATKDVTVTVNPKSLTIAAQDQNIMVGDTVPDLSAPVLNTHYTVTGLVGSDALTTAPTLAYSATPDNTRAGTYTITPSGANAGGSYAISYQTGTLTITAKPAATVTTAPTAKAGLTFNGVDQALVNAGAASGGTMQYALGANAAAAPTSGWGTAIPTGKEAKDYYVWYKAAGDAEHSDSDPACVTVTIGTTSLDAQGVTIYAIPDQNSTGEQIKPKPVVKHLGYLLVEGTDYELSYGENKEIGTGTGTVTITGKGGYSGTLTRTFNIVLPAYEGTLTVTAPSAYTYGDALGAAPAVTSSAGSLSGETVKVYYSATPSGEGTAWSSGEVLNAGTYYVWAELTKTATHDAATSARVTFTVSKATPAAPAGVLAASYADTYKVTLSIPGDKTYADYEYSLDGANWTSVPALKDGAFTPAGLSAGTAYTLSLRTKADSNHNASPAATATLKTPAKVLLSYDANGSTATVPASAEYDSGATVTAAAAITRAGYTFAGWNTAANGGGTAYAAGAAFTISANTTLYAQWTPITYSVDYHENGGNACTDETGKAYNAEITLPTPTYAEHTFNGWATVSGGSPVYRGGQKVSGLTSVNGATVDLYAVWTENTYKITGEVKEERDGTTEQSIVAGVTVKIMRGSVEFAATATDDYGKYTFSGVPAGSYNIVATRTVDGKNQTMTALVEVKSDKTVETIVLPPSGVNSALNVTGDSTPPVMVGGLDDVAKDEAEENKEVTVTMTVEQKDENTATEQQKQEMEEIKEAVAADSTTDEGSTELEFLDVKVEKKTEDGSTTTTEPITETSQVVEMIVPFNTSGRFGFIVYRWHDGKAEAFQKRSSPFASGSFMDGWYYVDVVAGLFHIYGSRFSTYAIGYEEGAGFTLTVNNGTGSGEFAVGTTITITADEPAAGKVFDKWTTNDGVEFADATASTTTFVMPAKNVTVTATYKDAPVTTYTATVVSGTGSGSYAAGASVTIKANPAPSGKVFDKWVSSDGVSFANAKSSTTTFTMPAKNVTVTATYKTASSPAPYYPGGGGNYTPTTYPPIVADAQHGKVTVSPTNPTSGTTVTITAKPDAGYEVDTVTVADASGKSVSVKDNGNNTYSFTQPSSKVTVKVTFKPVSSPTNDVFAPFSDLNTASWYADGVRYVLEHGIMSGMGDGLFQPSGTTTRAQLAQILYNMEGKPTVAGALNYTDVNPTYWYVEAIRCVDANDIMGGFGDGTFGPDVALTREQLVTILYRYAKYKGIDVSVGADTNILSYDDAFDISEWAIPAMQWAVGSGLISGKTASTLNPQDKASRAEIATIIMRYCEQIAK